MGTAARRLLPPALALALAIGVLPASPAAAAGDGVLSVSIEPIDYVTGQPITEASWNQPNVGYRVNFVCSVAACENTVVQFNPAQVNPWGITSTVPLRLLTFSTWTAPPTGGTVTGDDANGRTVNLGTLPAGTSGSFSISYSTTPARNANAAPGQIFPDGFQIANGVTISSSTAVAPAQADAAPVTWRISTVPAPSIVITNPGPIKPDVNISHQVRMSTGSFVRTGGNIVGRSNVFAAGNYTVTMQVPEEATFVSADRGGVWDPVARTVTWSEGTVDAPTYCAAGGWGATAAPQNNWNQNAPCYTPRNVVLNYPASAFTSDPSGCNFDETVTPSVAVTATYLDALRTTKTADASAAYPVTCYEPFGRLNAGKDSTADATAADRTTRLVNVPPDVSGETCPSSGRDDWNRVCTPGQPLAAFADNAKSWVVTGYNAGNAPGNITIADSTLDLPGAPVHAIRASATTPVPTIDWTYRCGSSAPVSGTTTATTVSLTAGQRSSGCRYTAATVTSGSVAGGNLRPADTATGTAWQVVFDYSVTTGAPLGVRTNTATVSISYPDTSIVTPSQTVSRNVQLREYPKVAAARPTFAAAFPVAAVVAGGGTAVPGRDVTFTVRGSTANIANDQDITPQYVFIAPVGWTIVPGSATFGTQTVSPGYQISPPRAVTIGGAQREAVVVTWPDTTVFGENAVWPDLSVTARPTFAVTAGTSSQATAWMGDSRHSFDSTTGTFNGGVQDAPDVDQDGSTSEWFASATQAVSVGSSSAATVLKEICLPDGAGGCNWVGDSSKPVPVSTTATDIRYRVTILNGGNTQLNGVVAYDVLPYVGDVGTSDATSSTPRGSTFAETLASASNISSGLTLSYSSSTSPPRPEVFSGSTTGSWGSTASGMRAIRAQYAGNLAPGASVRFEYTATVNPGSSADARACNSVAIDTAQTLPSEPPAVCAVTAEADLEIQVPDRLPLQEGRNGVLPYTVINHGGSQNAPATAVLDIPAGIQVRSLSPQGWACTASPSGSLPLDGPVRVSCVPVAPDGTTTTLAIGASRTLALAVKPLSADGPVCVPGEVAGAMYDPRPANNTSEGCLAVVPFDSALELSKTDGRDVVTPGDTVTYEITATNGLVGETVAGAVLTDTLPDDVVFVSATDGGVHTGAAPDGTGGTVTWPALDLAAAATPNSGGTGGSAAPGSSAVRAVTVTIAADARGQVENTAAVTATDPADSSATVRDEAADVDELQRLTVTKSSDAAPAGVRQGDAVAYTVTLTNDGTVDYATDEAALVDDLGEVLDDAAFATDSAEIRIDGGSPRTVADPDAGGLLRWTGALDVGSQLVLTYRVNVGDATGGDRVLTNTVFVGDSASVCTDGVDDDGDSCASVTATFAPTLLKRVASLTQNDDGTWTTVYDLVVTNLDPTAPTTYSLADALAFGAGIEVLDASVTSAPEGVVLTSPAWAGSGAVAQAVTLPADGQHTYQVTVIADAGATLGTAAATCVAGVTSGFANRATLSLADGRSFHEEACAAPAAPAVDKTAGAVSQLPDGSWQVTYTVTVSNTNPAPATLAYTLDDLLTVPTGIAVESVHTAGPADAALNPAFGTGDTALLTAPDRIPAGTVADPAIRVFSVTVVFDARAGAAPASGLACPPAGDGGYANRVTLLSGSSDTVIDTASACATALTQPVPDIRKSVASSSISGAGDWTLVYTIDVSNPSPTHSTRYSLEDELGFAEGVTVLDAVMTSSDGPTSEWDGRSTTVVTTDHLLAAGTTHRYTATVTADPGDFDVESAAADCRIDGGESGTGYRNLATLTSGDVTRTADACEPINDPSVVKTTVGAPTQDASTGTWTMRYDITVRNRSTTTTGSIPYELTDTLGFPEEVAIVDVAVSGPAGASINPDFDGVDSLELASGSIGQAIDANTPTTHTYRVTVRFDVPSGTLDAARCDPAQGGGGLRNEAEIRVGARVSGAVACADVPDVPVPGLTKSVLSQDQQADGTWEVLYRVTVANPSATSASTYTLDDEFALGEGIVLDEAPQVVALPAGVTAEPDWNGADATTISEDILLPAAGSHTYTVRAIIDSGSVTGNDPAGDCTVDAGETGTGFLNTASLSTGIATVDSSACATAWDPGVTKELNGVPTQQPDRSWLLSYTMTVSNPSTVGLSYGLRDELDFPADAEVTIVSAASRAGGPAVEADWDGQTQLQLVADGTPLAPSTLHVFDVTVRAVLPEDQGTEPGGWGNTATVVSGVDGVLTTDAVSTADVEVPELVVTKAVTTEDPVLRIGDEAVYEITIENTGDGDYTALYPAVVWDDLTDVLDETELVAAPTATPEVGTITSHGDRFDWTGALLAGETVTVSYTVEVTGGGNALLRNVAFQAQPLDVEPETPVVEDCETSTVCAVTASALPALSVEKTASGSSVAQGGSVQYTIVVTNTGAVDLPADDPAAMTDDLSDVLDDATLAGVPTSDTGEVVMDGTTLTWSGALDSGDVATITYAVNVRANAADGADLVNVAAVDGSLVSLTVDGVPAPRTSTTNTVVNALAATGAVITTTVLVGIALLLLGLLTVLYIQRRRRLGAE
ncbi:putative repeat protein (TIGR01451 family) [Diaminobutyricimonas aerilata]|uniref:Putative repeat protein (TIGR01451 family) n=1 Tax=Diaminobutyricimonas aerilata TaxID=1162967 RepID=A0A2M9CN02_9MICO|nr:DUF11 domain-containing protein [Diaminobutyricimonas aerilata]PJJ73234.1 putative repeat protein (TIGR01451 family) [Diaminobutyricimonas aerilata]